MIPMNTNDLPSQKRPQTLTYARVPKRPKLHDNQPCLPPDDLAVHPGVLLRRKVGDLIALKPSPEVDGEQGKMEERGAAGSGKVLLGLPVPVLLTNAATITVEGGKSGLAGATKGRTAYTPVAAPGVGRGAIEAYCKRIPVKKENIRGMAREGVADHAASTSSTSTSSAHTVATPAPTVETPSALSTTSAGTTFTPIRVSSPMAISSILNSSLTHISSPTPNPSSGPSASPPTSPVLPTTTTSRRKKHRPNPIQSPTKKLTQLHLDLGQAPSRTTCSTCHMSYDPSIAEDTLLHKKFHSKSTGGVDFISARLHILWAGIRFVQDAWEGRGREVIIVVGRDSNKLERRRVMEVMEVVERELGCQEIKEEDMFGVLKYDSRGRRVRDRGGDEGGKYKIFLYLLGRKCVGLLLAERIEEAYKITLPASALPSATLPTSIDLSDPCSSPPPPDHPLTLSPTPSSALLGISRIWTCSTHRRRGIATRLIDVARQAFIYGMTIEKSRVAFSQPTALGKALAEEWFLRETDAVRSVGDGGVENGLDEVWGEKREGVEKGGWLVYLDKSDVPG